VFIERIILLAHAGIVCDKSKSFVSIATMLTAHCSLHMQDTALSALRRNFFTNVESEIRTVEHTLTYMESALRGIPCERTFIAHYEQALADPISFIEPLAAFLELDGAGKAALTSRLTKKGKFPARKPHKLTQYKAHCAGLNEKACYHKMSRMLDEFFRERGFMWPTFAANGFDFVPRPL
jgi:hypothetical protein